MPRTRAEPGSERISAQEAAAVFSALAQETRLEVYRLLLRYQPFGLAAGDISRLMAVAHNTLSTHLAILQAAGLVRSRREGRSIIFAAHPARFAVAQRYLSLAVATPQKSLSPAPAIYPARRPDEAAVDKIGNVLVLCTGNSARSIMAEALLNREGHGRLRAYSAGSRPQGKPHPVAIELLSSLGYDTDGCRSKSWTEFTRPGAPRMDFIVTVCDKAAGETCPHWPGHPLTAHWGIPDPVVVAGTREQKRAAFHETYRRLMTRVTAFVNLPLDKLSLHDLKMRLAEIGSMDGATEMAMKGKAA